MADAPLDGSGLAFGFLPADVVHTLLDIGNWRKRASAMDAFHGHLRAHLAAGGPAPSHFPELAAFVYRLVKDPNFKICLSAMAELAAVVGAAPELARAEAPTIVPLLVDRLCDSKLPLRQQAHGVLRAMLAKLGPDATLAALAPCVGHYAARAREEIANAVIAALLSHRAFPFQWSTVVGALLTLMDDPKERVRLVALEGMALVADRLPASRLCNIFAALQCPGDEPERVTARAQQPERPRLTEEGFVQHCIDLGDGVSSVSGSGSAHSVPRALKGSLAQLPFEVPSPGQFRRTGSAASSNMGQGGLDGAPLFSVTRPRRSNPPLSEFSAHLPLSYFHGPTVAEADGGSTHTAVSTALTNQPSDSRRQSPSRLDALRQVKQLAMRPTAGDEFKSETLAACRTSVAEKLAGPPHALESGDSEASALIPARRSGRVPSLDCDLCSQGSSGSLPAHLTVRRSGCAASLAAAGSLRSSLTRSDSEAQSMLFERCAAPASPMSLTALSPIAKHTLFRRQPLRSASNVQSAPSSDAPASISGEPQSPSKSLRLESLKRRQAERRAQSAGLLTCPPLEPLAARRLSTAGGMAAAPLAHEPPQVRSPSRSSSGDDAQAAPAARPARALSRTPQVSGPRGAGLPRAMSRAASVGVPGREASLRLPTRAATVALPDHPPRDQAHAGSSAARAEIGTAPTEFDLRTTAASAHPEQDLARCLADLARANEAKRKELDWLAHQDAVNTMRRLLHHHADVVAASLRDVLAATMPCTAALRSSTAKAALLFFQARSHHLRALPRCCMLVQCHAGARNRQHSRACCRSCLRSSVAA